MQRPAPKNLLILFVILFSGAFQLHAQVSSFRLHQADSLFIQKQYTQSMEHYQLIFDHGQYSPAMLLKMAFIEEGLGQTGQALYHLNLYYEATNDPATLDKMEELADKFNLEGYAQSDGDRVLSFYHDVRWPLGLALMVIVFFLLSVSFFLMRRQKNAVAPLAVMGVFLVLLLVHGNFGDKISSGVIAKSNVRLMDGPSPGAGVVSVIDGGHRVEIIGRNDVWLKIKWRGRSAYVREGNLLPVRL